MEFLSLDAVAWQAIGTIALVGVTAVYVILTRKAVNAARSSADSAADSARSARRSIQLQSMPLLYPREAGVNANGMVEIQVQWLNDRPAFQIMATIRQGTVEWASDLEPILTAPPPPAPGSPTLPWQPSDIRLLSLTYPVSDPKQIDISQPNEIELTYVDSMGHGYRTTRRQLLDGDLFNIDELNETTREWQPIF